VSRIYSEMSYLFRLPGPSILTFLFFSSASSLGQIFGWLAMFTVMLAGGITCKSTGFTVAQVLTHGGVVVCSLPSCLGLGIVVTSFPALLFLAFIITGGFNIFQSLSPLATTLTFCNWLISLSIVGLGCLVDPVERTGSEILEALTTTPGIILMLVEEVITLTCYTYSEFEQSKPMGLFNMITAMLLQGLFATWVAATIAFIRDGVATWICVVAGFLFLFNVCPQLHINIFAQGESRMPLPQLGRLRCGEAEWEFLLFHLHLEGAKT